MVHNKATKSMAISILTTMLAGLILFFFDFHNQRFPKVEARLDVLESQVNDNQRYLERIDSKTQKIYEILLEKSK